MESRGSVAEDCVRAVCSVPIPTEPGVELDVPGGEWDALGSAGLSMTFTSQPCFKACLQEDECWPSLHPNFPVFCTTRAPQLCTPVLHCELVQDRESSGRQGSCRVPACLVEACGFRRAGVSLLQDGPVPLHHRPPPSAHCPVKAPKHMLNF